MVSVGAVVRFTTQMPDINFKQAGLLADIQNGVIDEPVVNASH